jgi:predicted aspartyl protease
MRAETSYDLVGDLIGVDAVLVGPAGRAEVTLILDTAAVMTTMVPSVAESIGYSHALRVGLSITRTAAAEEHGYIVRSEVSALGFTMTNHRVVVADLGYGIDGVLGINLLRHFNLEIRFAERRIRVERIAP